MNYPQLTAIFAVLLALYALVTAWRALHRVEKYKLTAPMVRELVAEINDALEKLANREARESMRRLRARNTKKEEEGDTPRPDWIPGDDPPPPPPATSRDQMKSELWGIVRGRVGQRREAP